MTKSLVSWLMYFLLSGSIHGLAQSKPIVVNQAKGLRVENDVSIFIDSTNHYTISQLIKQPYLFKKAEKNTDFGRNMFTNWLKFTIFNISGKTNDFFVYIYYPRLEHINSYAVSAKNTFTAFAPMGWGIPLYKRPFPHPKNVLPITLVAGERITLFLAVSSQYQRNIIPVSLHTRKQMLAKLQVATLTDGIVSCILFLVFLISVIYFVDSAFSEWGNLWYALYALSNFLFYLIRFDIQYMNQEYIAPILNGYVDILSTLLVLFYCISGTRFMSDVNINRLFASCYFCLLTITSLASIVLIFISSNQTFEAATTARIVQSVVGISGLLYVMIKGILNRKKYALIFIWMFVPLLLLYVLLTYSTDLSSGVADVDIDLKMKVAVCIETSLMMVGFIYKNNQKKHLLKRELAEQQQKTLLTQIQTQETERQRLAADLHDDLGGTLATIRQRLSDIRQHLPPSSAAQQLDALEPLIQKSGHDLRRIAHNLMPPDFARLGLHAALEQLITNQPTQPTRFSFIVAGQVRSLPAEVELNLYRIVSELVQNIHKHAHARQAAVQLLYHDDRLVITVEDDGVGNRLADNSLKESGIGLKNSSLRAEYIGASLRRESSPAGTFVALDVRYLTTPNASPGTNSNPAGRRSPPV